MTGLTDSRGVPWVIAGVPVKVRRSVRRRTVALQVRPGEVTLYAPPRVPLASLWAIVDARRAWVQHHLEQYAARPAPPWSFEDGATLPFLGEGLTLRVRADVHAVHRDGGDLLIPAGTPDKVQARVEAWTRRACLEPFRTLVGRAAGTLDLQARLGRVAVSSARQRWGSCNVQGDIRLHWKLTRAPLPVLSYVALHEAAHLEEFNHSRRYWALVEAAMPEYREHRDWLKERGHTL